MQMKFFDARHEENGGSDPAMPDEMKPMLNGKEPQPSDNRQALLEAIAKEQALVGRLDREQAEARNRLAALNTEIASLASGPENRLPPVVGGRSRKRPSRR